MDKATQQNAAMVEEMNAAGGALAEESRQLNALMAQFRVSDTSARRDGRAALAAVA
jgi:methyl-accepting chemotaxis protein